MKNPEKIVTSEKSLTVARVKQSWLKVERWDKRKMLHHLLTHEEPGLTVVFCRTKRTVDDVTKFLERKKIDAHAIHGDMYQSKRNQVMDRLRRLPGRARRQRPRRPRPRRGRHQPRHQLRHSRGSRGLHPPDRPNRPRRSRRSRLDAGHPGTGALADRVRDARQHRDPADGVRRLRARSRAVRHPSREGARGEAGEGSRDASEADRGSRHQGRRRSRLPRWSGAEVMPARRMRGRCGPVADERSPPFAQRRRSRTRWPRADPWSAWRPRCSPTAFLDRGPRPNSLEPDRTAGSLVGDFAWDPEAPLNLQSVKAIARAVRESAWSLRSPR